MREGSVNKVFMRASWSRHINTLLHYAIVIAATQLPVSSQSIQVLLV